MQQRADARFSPGKQPTFEQLDLVLAPIARDAFKHVRPAKRGMCTTQQVRQARPVAFGMSGQIERTEPPQQRAVADGVRAKTSQPMLKVRLLPWQQSIEVKAQAREDCADHAAQAIAAADACRSVCFGLRVAVHILRNW